LDPELHLHRTYEVEFKQAFVDAISALTPEERNLLHYHYVQRLNIDHLGAVFGVHHVTAAGRLRGRELAWSTPPASVSPSGSD
jgi:hypothetical protein